MLAGVPIYWVLSKRKRKQDKQDQEGSSG